VPRAENLYPVASAGLVGKHEAGAKSGKPVSDAKRWIGGKT